MAPPFTGSWGPVLPGGSPTDAAQQLAGLTSTDPVYLRHEFVSYQGGFEWRDSWSPAEAREAASFLLRGWPFHAASLHRHLARSAIITGARTQRAGPPLRTTWTMEGPTRAPGRFHVQDLQGVWDRQIRPGLAEKLWDLADMGASLVHVHYVPDLAAGIERPVCKRWPFEAMIWRGAGSPLSVGGWWAMTNDSGLVPITPNDGHWFWLSHGERWHEQGALLALAEIFVPDILAGRDEAGLSAAAGLAIPWINLPDGVPVGGVPAGQVGPPTAEQLIGQAMQTVAAGMGRAREAVVAPHDATATPYQAVSETKFFETYRQNRMIKVALAVLGQTGTMVQGAGGVYTAPVFADVAESLVDGDHEALERGIRLGLCRPCTEINGAGDLGIGLVGKRYRDVDAKAKAAATRATLFGSTVAAWRGAGLVPTQTQVDKLAADLSTDTITIGALPAPAAPKQPADALGPAVAAAAEKEETATP